MVKKSTFCKHRYHRKCKRRGVGGQKKLNLITIVCERPHSRIGHVLAKQLSKATLNHYHLDLPLSLVLFFLALVLPGFGELGQ